MQPWCFVHATDIHVGSPRSFRFAPSWNENWQTARQQIRAIGPDLLLLGGDLTRDGNIHRFELDAIKADLDALPFPYYVVPGNMDTGNKHTEVSGTVGRDDIALNLTSAQLEQFAEVFGPPWWTMVHKDVRFSGFCDMVAGSGLPEERAFWRWMDAQPEQPRTRHHVWIMHSALFIDDVDETNFDIIDPDHYLDWYFGIDNPARRHLLDVFRATGTDLVISGHVHCHRAHGVDGIRFEIGPSTAFGQWGNRWPDGDPRLGFLRYDVTDAGIRSTHVPLERVSTATGYGPGGHPSPDQRDYTVAWEK